MLSIEETPPTWLPFPPSSLCPVLLGRLGIQSYFWALLLSVLAPFRPSCPRCLSAGDSEWLHAMTLAQSPRESPRVAWGSASQQETGRAMKEGGAFSSVTTRGIIQPQKIEKIVTLSLALLEKFLRSPCFCPLRAQANNALSSTDTHSHQWSHKHQIVNHTTE